MNKQHFEEIMKSLVNQAKKNNNVLEDNDVKAAFKGAALTKEEQEQVKSFLEKLDIEVMIVSDAVEDELKELDLDVDKAVQIDDCYADDSIKLYFKEIGRIPLLTAEEEFELAKRAKRGDKAAKDKLTVANLRLVANVAKRHVGRGVSLQDLIQNGNMGLMRAVEKYDCDKGFRFSTYAYCWIRQAVTRSIADQGRIIRIPVHMSETVNHVRRFIKEYAVCYGVEPSVEVIVKETSYPEAKVKEALELLHDVVSLNIRIGEDEEGSYLGDFIKDESQNPEKDAAQTMLKEEIAKALDLLDPREKAIIIMRFGLDGNPPQTLESVGSKFQVTRERIRQIEMKAIRKFRQPSVARKLRDFVAA